MKDNNFWVWVWFRGLQGLMMYEKPIWVEPNPKFIGYESKNGIWDLGFGIFKCTQCLTFSFTRSTSIVTFKWHVTLCPTYRQMSYSFVPPDIVGEMEESNGFPTITMDNYKAVDDFHAIQESTAKPTRIIMRVLFLFVAMKKQSRQWIKMRWKWRRCICETIQRCICF